MLGSTPGYWQTLGFFLVGAAMLMVILGFVTYAILAERKVLGFMQLRHGPNRVGGRFGLLQTVADVLKLLLKEDTIPRDADRPLFIIAPIVAFAPAFIVIAALTLNRASIIRKHWRWFALLYRDIGYFDDWYPRWWVGIE